MWSLFGTGIDVERECSQFPEIPELRCSLSRQLAASAKSQSFEVGGVLDKCGQMIVPKSPCTFETQFLPKSISAGTIILAVLVNRLPQVEALGCL